jgi:hypothetical protein
MHHINKAPQGFRNFAGLSVYSAKAYPGRPGDLVPRKFLSKALPISSVCLMSFNY